jgi:hypothetical protein
MLPHFGFVVAFSVGTSGISLTPTGHLIVIQFDTESA